MRIILMLRMRALLLLPILALAPLASRAADDSSRGVHIKDITTIEGVRDNPLIGYGVVVGLTRTGDSQQTVFSIQTLTNLLQQMGLQVPASTVRVNNIAAVMVTATLPPFCQRTSRVHASHRGRR
jgi:flagellar P-ring protein FlgI